MNIEQHHRIDTAVQKLEDDANTKAAVLNTFKSLVPELSEKYSLSLDQQKLIEVYVQETLTRSEKTELRDLLSEVAEAVSETFEQMHKNEKGVDLVLRTALQARMQDDF